MQDKPSLLPLFFAAALAGGVILLFSDARAVGPASELSEVFATNINRMQAKEDAAALAEIAGASAQILAYDGQLAKPRFTTAMQVDDMRASVREYRMEGWSFLSRYPTLADHLDRIFAPVGNSTGPLSPERRSAWIDAFKRLQSEANAAASAL